MEVSVSSRVLAETLPVRGWGLGGRLSVYNPPMKAWVYVSNIKLLPTLYKALSLSTSSKRKEKKERKRKRVSCASLLPGVTS